MEWRKAFKRRGNCSALLFALVVNFQRRKLVNSVQPITAFLFFREPGNRC